MTIAITSFTPETGPVTGGTEVTVTGTGLGPTVAVLVGGNEATIVGTPSATTVVFVTPPGASASAFKVALYDGTNPSVEATDSFTYTAVSAATELITTLAFKWRLDINSASFASPTWVKMLGIKTIVPALAFSSEDDSDIDTGIDASTLITGRNASVTGTVRRAQIVDSTNYDPGQELVRLAAEAAGTQAGTIDIRWYDRTGGPEAYRAFALSQWSPKGGNKTADTADFTLSVQGKRTTITNPVLADPTLSDGLFTG